jgi:threonine/homoserine/homoserine lactone efflux protein
MGIINFTAFVITSFLFIITPGIDTIFILNKSIAQGKKFGLYSTLGITTGVLVHTTFAAFGLSLILAQSAMAFNIIKYLGAIYLIYLGITKFFAHDSINQNDVDKTTSVKKPI